MKAGWEVKTLGEVATFVMGQAPAGSDCNKDGIGTPFVKAGEFGDSRPVIREWTTDPKKFAKESDVLICVVGATCGKINLGADCAIGRSAAAIRPNTKMLDQFYLHYYLEGQVQAFRAGSLGAAQTVISREMLSEMKFPLPPLDEQKRIVEVLDAAFEGLTRARAHTETNLQNARELFESELKAAFTSNVSHWRSATLGNICTKIGSGATPRGGAESYATEGISLIRSLNVHDRSFRFEKLAFIDEDQANSLSNVVVEADDVLLNITGASVARCCQVPAEVLPARVNQHVSILRPDPNTLDPTFLCYGLTSEVFKNLLLATGEEGGTTRQAITKAQLVELEVQFPHDLADQRKIVDHLSNAESDVERLKSHYRAKLADLDDLRQSLLQKAFAGELT